MIKIAHITDPHLIKPGERLYGEDPCQGFRAALAHIARHHGDAEFVAVTGDLTNGGAAEAYAALRDAATTLPMPVFAIPGNHDDRETMASVMPDIPRDDNGFIQYAVVRQWGVCIFLDSLLPGSSSGRLCEQRLEWLRETLARHTHMPAYLFMHHPPLAIGMPGMDAIGLQNPQELLRVLKTHGNIRHLFFGHVHRAVSGTWHGIPYSAQRGTNHQMALDTSDSGEIVGSLETPAYSLVTGNADALSVHVVAYADAAPRFPLKSREARLAQSRNALPSP